MKKTFSLIAAVLLCASALNGAVSEDRDLGNFSAVVVSGPVEITYSQDEVCGIFVESAVDERMKNLITEVDKTGCLTIRPKPINKRLVEDIRGIKITLSSPYLFKIHCSGESSFTSLTDIENGSRPLDIKVADEVTMKLHAITASDLKIVSDGYARCTIDGDINAASLSVESAAEDGVILQGVSVEYYVNFSVNTVSKIQLAKDLECDSLNVTVLGTSGVPSRVDFNNITTRSCNIFADENVKVNADIVEVNNIGIEANRCEINIQQIPEAEFFYVIADKGAKVKVGNVTSEQANFNLRRSSRLETSGIIGIIKTKLDRTSKLDYTDLTPKEEELEKIDEKEAEAALNAATGESTAAKQTAKQGDDSKKQSVAQGDDAKKQTVDKKKDTKKKPAKKKKRPRRPRGFR